MSDIADRLNDYNIPTNYSRFIKKGSIEYKKKSGVSVTVKKENLNWVKNTVYSILKNTVYTGNKSLKTREKIDGKTVKKEVKKIETPVIIELDTYLKAQKQMKQKIKIASKSFKRDYLLRGLLRCDCGNFYVGTSISKTGNYYRCSDRVHNNSRTSIGCRNVDLNTKRADYMIWETVKNIYKEYALQETQQKTESDFTKENNHIDGEIYRIETNIKKLTSQSKSIARRMITVSDNVFEILNDEAKKIDNQINAFNMDINSLKLKKADLKQYIARIDELKQMNFKKFDISSVENDFNSKKEAIKKIVEKIVVSNTSDANGKRFVIFKIYLYNHNLSSFNDKNRIISYQPHKSIWAITVMSPHKYDEKTEKEVLTLMLNKYHYSKLPDMK